jgi:hypothetical protein
LKTVKNAFSLHKDLRDRENFIVSEYKKAGKYPKVLIFNYPKKPNTGTAQMDFFRRNGGAKFNCVGYDGYIIDIVW